MGSDGDMGGRQRHKNGRRVDGEVLSWEDKSIRSRVLNFVSTLSFLVFIEITKIQIKKMAFGEPYRNLVNSDFGRHQKS